jgi:hypothetical protein
MANRFSPETTVWNRMSSAGVTIDGDYDMMDWMGNRRHILLAAVTGSAIIATACGHRPATADAHLFFPTRHEQGGDMMEALYAGPLVVRDECVLIGRPGEYSLPIWWKGFTAEPDESGRVVVRDGDGAIVAIEDERFEMGAALPRSSIQERNGGMCRFEESSSGLVTQSPIDASALMSMASGS